MSILNSAINSIEVLCDQVLSKLIIIGSGTSNLEINLQLLKNSLLPNLREIEDNLQKCVSLIRSTLDILESNLGNNSFAIKKEILKIRNSLQELIKQESDTQRDLNRYRDLLIANHQEMETKDKKDLLKEQKNNSDELQNLEKQKKTSPK